MSNGELAISIKNLTVSLADRTILRGLSLDVHRGEILGWSVPQAAASLFCYAPFWG